MKSLLSLLLISLLSMGVYSQDLIITQDNKTLTPNIAGANNNSLYFDNNGNPLPYSMDDVKLVILKEGYYINPSRLIKQNCSFDVFKNKNKSRIGEHSHLIKSNGDVIQTNDILEKFDEIAYIDSRTNTTVSIPKEDVICIIKKGEAVKLLINPDIVDYKLRNRDYFDYCSKPVFTEPTSKNKKDKTRKNPKVDPVSEAPDNIKVITESPAAPAAPELIPIEEVLGDKVTVEEYKRLAKDKVTQLGDYINIISNTETERPEQHKAINQAVNLFLKESSTVEVTSVNRPEAKPNVYPIRNYLNKLTSLKYDKIEIAWSEIGYISQLYSGTDGNMYATATVKQRFTGIIENRPVYQDVTIKRVEVVFKNTQVTRAGDIIDKFEIFLNNIGVTSTTKE